MHGYTLLLLHTAVVQISDSMVYLSSPAGIGQAKQRWKFWCTCRSNWKRLWLGYRGLGEFQSSVKAFGVDCKNGTFVEKKTEGCVVLSDINKFLCLQSKIWDTCEPINFRGGSYSASVASVALICIRCWSAEKCFPGNISLPASLWQGLDKTEIINNGFKNIFRIVWETVIFKKKWSCDFSVERHKNAAWVGKAYRKEVLFQV